MFSKIIATGSYLPSNILTNQDLEKKVDTTDEWIRSRTGIERRSIADPQQATSDLGYEAAKKAIDRSGIDKHEIDYFMFHQPNKFMLNKLADKLKIPHVSQPQITITHHPPVSEIVRSSETPP